MRLLLALLLALSADLSASAPGTQNYWPLDNAFTDPFGGDSLTQNGTVPFVTTPGPPSPNTYWAGPFSDANYLTFSASAFPQAQGCITSVLQQTGGFQYNWIVAKDASNRMNLLSFSNKLYVQYYDTAGSEISLTYTVAANTNLYVMVNWSSSSVSLWVGTAPENVAKVYEDTTHQLRTYVPTTFTIGRNSLATGQAWTGYTGQFRILTTNQTAWPSDSSPTPSFTISPTFTASPTISPTHTISPTPSATPTPTPRMLIKSFIDTDVNANYASASPGDWHEISGTTPIPTQVACVNVGTHSTGPQYRAPFGYLYYLDGEVASLSGTAYSVGAYYYIARTDVAQSLAVWGGEMGPNINMPYVKVGGELLFIYGNNLTLTSGVTLQTGDCKYIGMAADASNVYGWCFNPGLFNQPPINSVAYAGKSGYVDRFTFHPMFGDKGLDGIASYINNLVVFTTYIPYAPFDGAGPSGTDNPPYYLRRRPLWPVAPRK